MRPEITIGPPLLTINQGQTVLACEPEGRIQSGTDKGLYFRDTRVMSVYDLAANGASFKLLNAGSINYHASRSMLTNTEIKTEDGIIPSGVLSVTLGRSVDGGLHEDIDIANYGPRKVRFNLEILIRSDFADIFEVKAGDIVRRGRTATDWDEASATLRTVFESGAFRRQIMVQAAQSDSRCRYANGRMTFEVEIEQGGRWRTCLLYTLVDGERRHAPPKSCVAHADSSRLGQELEAWRLPAISPSQNNSDVPFCWLRDRPELPDTRSLKG